MPRNNLLPELIRKDGSNTPLAQIKEIEGLMDLVNESFLKKHPEPTIIYNGTHNIPNLDSKRLRITEGAIINSIY